MDIKFPNTFFLLICLLLSHIPFAHSEASILEFDAFGYRAGHFAFDSRGDMIIEYSRNHHRLFFGLKKDGNVFFEDDDHNLSPTKEFLIGENENTCKRYESENMFVTNNVNGEEYLFTLGTSESFTELHDIDNDRFIYKSTGSFLGNEEIFSFRFPLLNITRENGNKEYVVAFLCQADQKYKLKKFSFSSFTLDNNNLQTNPDQYHLKFNQRISSGFIMNNWIVVFFIDWQKNYAISIYDFDLNWKNRESIQTIDSLEYEFIVPNVERPGVFYKSCCLRDNYAFFIYFTKDASNSLKFKVYQINLIDNVCSITEKLAKNFWDYGYNYKFNLESRLNELIKINQERLAFITLPDNSMNWIYIFLFDFFDNYNKVKIREYHENFDNKYQLELEFAGDVYNGHLIYTAVTKDVHSSILMIFGYANATDEIIDVSNYFAEIDVNNEYSMFRFLRDRTIIENNIFGYEKLEYPVILVYIPPEMFFII